MAQWIRHQTSDLGIAGSSPVTVDSFCFLLQNFNEPSNSKRGKKDLGSVLPLSVGTLQHVVFRLYNEI